MDTSRNPGLLALIAGVGLGVLFALLGITQVMEPRIGFGLAVVSFIVGLLIYLFFMRGTTVAKTGYASLVMLLLVGLIIPFELIFQQQSQATQASTKYDQTLHQGAALFGQYCAPCHGYQGKGKIGPQLNGVGVGSPPVNKLTDDEVRRTISAGVPNSGDLSAAKAVMPAWLNSYGGPLTEEDITYLISLIRSSDPDYLKANKLPNTNGFSFVLGTLTNPTQIAQYHLDEASAGSAKPGADQFVDETGKKAVTIDAVDSPPGGQAYGWEVAGSTLPNMNISVGTTVTWANKSAGVPHNVYSGPSGKPDGKFKSDLIMPGGAPFTYTFTAAGDYPYYCALHPFMIGWITVK